MIVTTAETVPGREITEILLIIARRVEDKDKEDFEKRKY